MIFNVYAQVVLCLGFLVETSFCVKWLARLSIFIHADILALVSEFVVVVSGGRCRPLLTTVSISLIIICDPDKLSLHIWHCNISIFQYSYLM